MSALTSLIIKLNNFFIYSNLELTNLECPYIILQSSISVGGNMDLEKMKESAQEATELLKTMAHPERLLVLCQLVDGEISAGALQEKSALSQSAFSQHLGVLRKHGLVQTRKDAQQVFYSLADSRVKKLLETMQATFCK